MYFSFQLGRQSVGSPEVSDIAVLDFPEHSHEFGLNDSYTGPVDFMRNIETVSWHPRAQVYHNFLSKAECEEIIALSEPHMERSTVVNNEGKVSTDNARSSSGYWFMQRHPILLKAVRQIEDWTRLPQRNGEAFYVLRYDIGQQYKAHVDFFGGNYLKTGQNARAGNRIATVLVYLHTPEEGGETVFPGTSKTVTVQARQGTALLFWDYLPNVEPDRDSLHAGLPVIKGIKWSMTRWLRMREFGDYYG